jgi:glycosyltransferase involved in cell wall biosynthesis
MKKIIYVCAKSYYFTEGYCGRVIHAKGIVEGLLANGCDVEIVSGLGISKYLEEHDQLTRTTIGEKRTNILEEVLWRKKLLKYLKNNIDKFDLLILRYAFSNPLLTFRISRLCKSNNCHSVIEVNSLGTDYKNKIKLFRRFIKRFEIYVLSYFDTIYVVSEEEKRRIEEISSALNIVVIPNATHNRFLASESESDKIRFVYLGRLNHYYNFDEVLFSFKEVANDLSKTIELIIFGYGQNDVSLRVNAAKDSNIKMMGKYDNNTITNLVNRDTDIFLLPSKRGSSAEITSPLKLFEYLVLGAPILASNVGQITDIIQHKENGYIYEAGNISDLADKMRYLIDHKEERKDVGLKAHNEAIKKHTWENRMKKLLRICNLS